MGKFLNKFKITDEVYSLLPDDILDKQTGKLIIDRIEIDLNNQVVSLFNKDRELFEGKFPTSFNNKDTIILDNIEMRIGLEIE